jgi:hypothetical protein
MSTMTKTCLALIGLAAAAAAACAPSRLAPTTFSADYTMMGSIGDFSTAPECATYGELEIVAPADLDKVGVRYLEEGSERWDVGMTGDAEAWLRAGVESALRAASIEQSDSGPTLTVELVSITTDEAVYRQAEYDAKVVLRIAVTGGGADWKGTKDGFAENYGRPGSSTNYQETVNHALDRALTAMVNDQGFRDALCK